MDRPFILTTDASKVAISYILSQKNESNVEHVIAYAGRALRNAEINYGITDKEGLAVVEGFRHFHTYLYGNVTTVITDHSPLVYIKNNTKLTGRVARWAILLQNYDYDVIYKKGSENTNADALSRVEVPDMEHDLQRVEEIETRHADVFTVCESDVLTKFPLLEVIFEPDEYHISESAMQIQQIEMAKAQRDCPEIGSMYQYIQNGTLPDDDDEAKSIIRHAEQYGMFSDILYHIHEPRTKNKFKFDKTIHQIVIPKDLRYQILSDYHDSLIGGGHQGFQRTYDAVRAKYYWPGMYRDTRDYQMSCLRCQRAKQPRQKRVPLHSLPVAGLFHRFHMDFIGPLKTAADGSKYILLIVDSFSRWPEAFPLPASDATTVARVLYREIFTRYGAPRSLVSDRGPQFMSSLVNALCAIFGTKRTLSSPYHPQTNSTCERFNSYLEATMRAYVNDDQSDWPHTLPGILMAYRNTQAHRSTEFSPFYLLFGEQMQTPIDREISADIPDISAQYEGSMKSVLDNVKLSRTVAEQNILRHQEQNKMFHDRKAVEPSYEMGDLVWLYDPRVPVGYSRKIRAQWVGPFNICEIGPNCTYRLRHANTREISKTLINAARLKLATALEESTVRLQQQRLQNQLRQERADRQARRDTHDQRGAGDPPRGRHEPHPPDRQNVQGPTAEPEQADPPVEKVVNLKRSNKIKWFKVKIRGKPGYHWRREGFVKISQHLINECLRYRTWSGEPRKRRVTKK